MINSSLLKKQDLQKDIKQLKKLILQTQNQRVGEFLADKLSSIKAELQLIQQQEIKPVQVNTKISQTKQPQVITITKFAWEQIPTTNKIKIMIHMEEIKILCTENQIVPSFKPHSITVKINQYKNKNYIFSIPKLYAEIIPEKCSYKLTKNYLVLELQKKHPGQWIDVHFRKDIFTPKKQEQKRKMQHMGQHEKLLDMVKKIYDEGDPQYQKIIKQAFNNAQDKRKINF